MSDFSVYTAEQVVDFMSQGTVNTAPTDIYVTLYDDTGTELDGDFANARVQTAAGTDWTDNGSSFTNANLIDFGEAGADLTNIQDVALFDAATGGNELARYQLNDAPFDISSGSTLEFAATDLSFDVRDRTQ